MQTDPFAQFKATQREGWGLFAPLDIFTTQAAFHLVSFSKLKSGQQVLDVACGTGVVAITAGRQGAHVRAMDLAPALVERARANAKIANLEIEFQEGDVEALPYSDATFDVVLSQFGHMFAPRPAVAIAEMLRVLKPGGTIAFSTWPPELYTGLMFALVAKYLPPPPGIAPPPQWGEPSTVRERLGDAVKDLSFERETMLATGLSPQHLRTLFESTAAPLIKLKETLKDDPKRLDDFHSELEALIARFMVGNSLRQQFLMSRAVKK